MKIALIYSGLPSFDQEIFDNHYKYIIKPYNPDIFISTYESEKISDIHNTYKPKSIHIEDYSLIEPYLEKLSSFILNVCHETKVVNSLSMFYKIHRGFCLIDNSYDIIIRNRFDIKFDKQLEIEQNASLNVPFGGDHRGGLMDMFAYGNYENMSVYSNLVLFIASYLRYHNAVFHPESLLRGHCKINNIDIKRFDFNIYLRGMCFNDTAPTYY